MGTPISRWATMQKSDSNSLRDLVHVVVTYLVDEPSAVQVTERSGEHTTVFEVIVAKGDVGKVIGKQGRIVTSVRTILSAAGAKQRKRVVLEIIE